MIRTLFFLVVIVVFPAVGFADEKMPQSSQLIDAKLSFAADDVGFGRMVTLGYGFGGTLYSHLRFDVNYYRWNGTNGSVDWSVTRVPFYGGWRWTFKTAPALYIEGGAELAYERTDAFYTGPLYGKGSGGYRTVHTEMGLYLVPGIGLEFPVVGKMIIGLNARAHAAGGVQRVFYPTYGMTIGYGF